MSIGNRYLPSLAPGEQCTLGLDLSAIIPPGLGLTGASVSAVRNTNPTTPAPEITLGAVSVKGRRCWATVQGQIAGTDYQVRFVATDNQGSVWPRTILALCAATD